MLVKRLGFVSVTLLLSSLISFSNGYSIGLATREHRFRRTMLRVVTELTNGLVVRHTIKYSHSFQRHVVLDSNQTVIGSYEFLDEALDDYPDSDLTSLQNLEMLDTVDDIELCFATIGGSGIELQSADLKSRDISSTHHSFRAKSSHGALMTLSKLVAEVPGSDHASALYLAQNFGRLRFQHHSPESMQRNYKSIIKLLKSNLDMEPSVARRKVLSVFPQLCLYDVDEIATRIQFFVAQPPPIAMTRAKRLDWPLLASQGYGAGLTKEQLRIALYSVPHILAMNYEDSAQKPAIGYFLHILQSPFHLANKAIEELKEYLDGASYSDIALVTFLCNLGISWNQLRILLDAFPTIVVCDTQPSVEMLTKGIVRRDVAPHRLHYLQKRLQIRPAQVKAMFITHSRLGSYSIQGKVKPTLDAIQRRLGLSSNELRQIILRQPSLIGMTVATNRGFNQRIDFLLTEIQMNIQEVKKAVVRHPSLLEYHVETTFRPKLSFLTDELCVPKSKCAKVLKTNPGIMGLSLDDNLRPSAEQFMSFLNLNPKEMGSLVSTAPQILALSWKGNLEPKLRYLLNRLDIDITGMKDIIKMAPRLLLYSLDRSLDPKLSMIENMLSVSGSIHSLRDVVRLNPSILVTTNDLLRKRLDLVQKKVLVSRLDYGDYLLPRQNPSNSAITLPGMNARELKTSIGVSSEVPIWHVSNLDNANKVPVAMDNKTLSNSIRSDSSPDILHIVVYVAGRIYPRDSCSRVRGSSQKGGVSLYFPQVAYGTPELRAAFAQLCMACFPQRIPETEYNFLRPEGVSCIRFPGLRASRMRTELSACHCALRAVLGWLVQETGINSLASQAKYHVNIYTGSEAVYRILHNETTLLQWGSFDSIMAWRNGTKDCKTPRNLDLLWPLCRTFSRITKLCSVPDQNGTAIILGKEIKIKFVHNSDSDYEDETIHTLGALARMAARWNYMHGLET